MAVAVGSVAVPGSTGNFTITGLPFEPVAFVFFNQFDQLGAHSMFIGAATHTDEQWVVWSGTATELAGYNSRKHESRTDVCCIHRNSVTNALQWQVTFVSMETDGATLNLDVRNSVSSGEGGNIYYMAVGGAHISEAFAGTFLTGGATGTEAVTDPGFQPTALILAYTGDFGWDAGPVGGYLFGTGVAAENAQNSNFAWGVQGAATSYQHIERTDAVACVAIGANTFRMELDSFDSTGFTVDTIDAYPNDITFGYLALNATGAVAGANTQPASDGIQTYSTPLLEPGGVFFCWNGVDTPSSSGATTGGPMRPGVGAGTLTQERLSAGIFRDEAPFGVWTSDGYQIGTESLGFWGCCDGIVGNSNLSTGSAVIDAFDPGSFDLDWTNTDGNDDRLFGWLALPGEILANWIPEFNRVRTRDLQ